jgi:hypothetical protein
MLLVCKTNKHGASFFQKWGVTKLCGSSSSNESLRLWKDLVKRSGADPTKEPPPKSAGATITSGVIGSETALALSPHLF